MLFFFFLFFMSILKQSRQRFGRFAFSKHGSKLFAHLFSAIACGACINNMTCIRQTVTVTTQHFLNISHIPRHKQKGIHNPVVDMHSGNNYILHRYIKKKTQRLCDFFSFLL